MSYEGKTEGRGQEAGSSRQGQTKKAKVKRQNEKQAFASFEFRGKSRRD